MTDNQMQRRKSAEGDIGSVPIFL